MDGRHPFPCPPLGANSHTLVVHFSVHINHKVAGYVPNLLGVGFTLDKIILTEKYQHGSTSEYEINRKITCPGGVQ